MNFDIVIGNPPYNNDVYLDFMENAHKVSRICSLMIVPAKWQTKGGARNEKFRDNIVPYMGKVVYYPDCLDVFGISEAPGVTYCLIDKQVHEKTYIVNKNNYQPLVNSEETRSIRNGESLWNIGNRILNKINGKPYEFKLIPHDKRLDYTLSISKMWCGSRVSSGAWDFKTSTINTEYIGKGGVVFNPTGDIRVLGRMQRLKLSEYNKSGSAVNIFTTDNISELESFESWLNTKFVSFILLVSLSSATIMSQSAWKNIPDPGEFNHIFTDSELYKKYDLTADEIDIIERLIRENKWA